MAEYGPYIAKAYNTLMVRVPGTKQRSYSVEDAAKAMAERDKLMAAQGIRRQDHVNVLFGVAKKPKANRKNPELPQYIHCYKEHRTGNEYLRAFAMGMRKCGKLGAIHKDMSIKKHGYDTCIRELLKWRKEQETKYAKGS